MITVEVKGLKKISRFLSDAHKKQIPFATSVAINKTAKSIKTATEVDINKVFDRPTRTTQKSLFVKFSTKRKLRASVEIKDFAGKGTPPADYLRHHIEGGKRDFKRSEKALHRAGILPKGWYTMLADDAKLNRYGNMPGGQYTKLLSQVRALSEIGYTGNRARGRGTTYFTTKHGVFKRTGKRTIKHILYFSRKTPTYKVRLPFYGTANKVFNKEFDHHFNRAFKIAMSTAR